MKSIKVTIQGQQYPLKIEEGDENAMFEIAEYVDKRLGDFKTALKNQRDSTVMVLAALSIAEELFIERSDNSNSESSEFGASEEEIYTSVNTRLEKLLADIKQNNSDI